MASPLWSTRAPCGGHTPAERRGHESSVPRSRSGARADVEVAQTGCVSTRERAARGELVAVELVSSASTSGADAACSGRRRGTPPPRRAWGGRHGPTIDRLRLCRSANAKTAAPPPHPAGPVGQSFRRFREPWPARASVSRPARHAQGACNVDNGAQWAPLHRAIVKDEMIVVTPNLCIDRTHMARPLRPGPVNRRAGQVDAGGKGVNVARRCATWADATVLGFDGRGGDQLERCCTRRLACRMVARRDSARDRSGRTSGGPRCSTSPADARRVTATPADGSPSSCRHRGRWCGSGSRRGAAADTYAELCRNAGARRAGLVDAPGTRWPGAGAEPDMVTPTRRGGEICTAGWSSSPRAARTGPSRERAAGRPARARPGTGGPWSRGRPARLRRRRGRAVVRRAARAVGQPIGAGELRRRGRRHLCSGRLAGPVRRGVLVARPRSSTRTPAGFARVAVSRLVAAGAGRMRRPT